MTNFNSLADLGWQTFFQQQLSLDEWGEAIPARVVEQIQALDSLLMVEAVNCLDAESVSKLTPRIKEGTTSAVLGSSGVGKSTLINTLLGEMRQSTGDIRDDDGKGRHTKTRRSLIYLSAGGVILDTPGIREIQIADCKEGIATTFADIEALRLPERNRDCGSAIHERGPEMLAD